MQVKVLGTLALIDEGNTYYYYLHIHFTAVSTMWYFITRLAELFSLMTKGLSKMK